MNKKNYTAPALSVEEYEMIIITSTSSSQVNNLGGNVFNQNGINGGTGPAYGNQRRGIWDED